MALAFIKDFKKSVQKHENVNIGLMAPQEWLSTGNYALNYALTGNFNRGIPLSRMTLFAGPSGCLPADEYVEIYEFKSTPFGKIEIEEVKEM